MGNHPDGHNGFSPDSSIDIFQQVGYCAEGLIVRSCDISPLGVEAGVGAGDQRHLRQIHERDDNM